MHALRFTKLGAGLGNAGRILPVLELEIQVLNIVQNSLEKNKKTSGSAKRNKYYSCWTKFEGDNRNFSELVEECG